MSAHSLLLHPLKVTLQKIDDLCVNRADLVGGKDLNLSEDRRILAEIDHNRHIARYGRFLDASLIFRCTYRFDSLTARFPTRFFLHSFPHA